MAVTDAPVGLQDIDNNTKSGEILDTLVEKESTKTVFTVPTITNESSEVEPVVLEPTSGDKSRELPAEEEPKVVNVVEPEKTEEPEESFYPTSTRMAASSTVPTSSTKANEVSLETSSKRIIVITVPTETLQESPVKAVETAKPSESTVVDTTSTTAATPTTTATGKATTEEVVDKDGWTLN